MSAIICRQPNGRLCRFSTVTDCITHYNMTEKHYIELCKDRAVEEAKDVINNHLMPFSSIEKYFAPTNMSEAKFKRILKEMNEPIEDTANAVQC